MYYVGVQIFLRKMDKFCGNTKVAQYNVLGECGIGHAKTAKPIELPFRMVG